VVVCPTPFCGGCFATLPLSPPYICVFLLPPSCSAVISVCRSAVACSPAPACRGQLNPLALVLPLPPPCGVLGVRTNQYPYYQSRCSSECAYQSHLDSDAPWHNSLHCQACARVQLSVPDGRTFMRGNTRVEISLFSCSMCLCDGVVPARLH